MALPEWKETCETCPFFEPMSRPAELPENVEFRLGACNGVPDVVCMIPVQAPPQIQRRVLEPNKAPPQLISLAPETFRRLVDYKRPACSVHPKWQAYLSDYVAMLD